MGNLLFNKDLQQCSKINKEKKNIKQRRSTIRFLTFSLTGITILIGAERLNIKDSMYYLDQINSFIESFVADDFQIVGHRGYSCKALDNSKLAILMCNESDYVDAVEVDIMITKDHKFILNHDETINRSIVAETDFETLGQIKKGLVYKMSLETFLKSFHSKQDGYLLRQRERDLIGKTAELIEPHEALEICQNKEMIWDLKINTSVEEYAKQFISYLVDNHIDISNIKFQSNNIEILKRLQEEIIYGKIPNCLPIIRSEKQLLTYKNDFDAFNVKKSLLSNSLIPELLDDGKQIYAWNFMNKAEIKSVIVTLGPNYYDQIHYITDIPDIVAFELNHYQKQTQKSLKR